MKNKTRKPIIAPQHRKPLWIIITMIICVLAVLIGFSIASRFNVVVYTPNEQVIKKDYKTRKDYRQTKKNYNNSSFRYNNTKSYYQSNEDSGKSFPVSSNQQERTFYPVKEKKDLIFDLNKADTLDLQALRGVGPSYARRIVAYRNKLGGYTNVEQLKEVYGMTKELYAQIAPHLVVKNPQLRKLNLNTENIKELMAHPYIDFYLAKAIISFHKDYGAFQQVEDVRKVHLLDDETYKKIIPYLEVK